MAICERCGGKGTILISSHCSRCNGTSEIIVYDDDGTERIVGCPNCEFGLVFSDETCVMCKGTGEVY